MNYPLISEYIEAIRSAEDNFGKLSNLRPILDDCGNPIMSSGNFAVVFKMEDIDTGKLYAVKCFTREQEEREERYQEIINTLKKFHSPYIVSIQYLDKELFVDTTQGDTTEYPIVLMDWVEGIRLDEYLRKIEGNKFKRELLAKEFQKFVCWLLPKPFAHGDLNPDNIIIKEDGSIVLVDYDGIFVPSLYGKSALETGTPMFQYKGRTLSDFNEYIDDYAAVFLLLILKVNAISVVNLEDYLLENNTEFIKKFEPYLNEKTFAPLLAAYLMVSTFGRIDRQQIYCLLTDNSDFDARKETELLYAARKGDTVAMINLGDLYRKGVYVPGSDSKAMQWYELAQRLGNVEATCRLCKCYTSGEDFGFSPKNSMLVDSLEKHKINFAYCRKGEDYFLSGIRGSKDDFLKAAYWLEKAAMAGNTGAQSWMATLYKEGCGVKKDSDKAEYWLKKAADAGNATAQNHLGDNYAESEKDFKKAIYWWEKAAANGDFFAQYRIAICYEKGNGVKKDLAKSVYWLQKAAEIGYTTDPLYKLGICYEDGLGVEKDLKRAIFWYEKAANKGHAEAQNKIGNCYKDGVGVEKNPTKAVYWYKKAAEKGIPEAQKNLGYCYENGIGVEKDCDKATYWYEKSDKSNT